MKHILIAEDELVIRKSMARVLKKAGYKVSTADDGEQALDCIQSALNEGEWIDLLLTDIQMPNLTGLELLEKLSQEKIEMCIAGISSFGDRETLVEMMRRGCADFIDKPFTPHELLEGVERLLERDEMVNAARKEKELTIRRERDALGAELTEFKQEFGKLRTQVDNAVSAYKAIVEIAESTKIDVAFKSCTFEDIGGDFVGVIDTDTGCEVLLADVAGHDMGASYYTVLVNSHFSDLSNRVTGNADVFMTSLNEKLVNSGSADRMVTASFLDINTETKVCTIASAAHPPVLFQKSGDLSIEVLDAGGDMLALHNEIVLDLCSIKLRSGDRFFLYTDGILDCCSIDEQGKKTPFGEKNLVDTLERHASLSLHSMISKVWKDIAAYANNGFNDDTMILAIEVP